ncbi:hypothetical protein CCMSSC00406_0001401 [Pleurotus cornucopiae]|uniref:Uncharacterized protein n=1 Tax=Pleurotus cornucopiae TaxID=5321 RepID=A0ACB7IPM3_PLECO|nr:hypothetical protein CCMSSC00406_0001401 [Pleurotus cornucopiae]
MTTTNGNGGDRDGFEERLRQRTMMRHPLETVPDSATVRPHGNIPNTPLAASVISFLLGTLFCFGAISAIFSGSSLWFTNYQLGFFVAAWSLFHWAEFAVTAGWNFEKCSVDSFLLDNGREYHIANGTALTEYLITLYFKPSWKGFPYISLIGMFFVALGQVVRSAAMIHASTNFSHAVAYRKRDQHRLVTDGIYAWSRHPSYAGFVYWALGTQLVLQNPITFTLYAALLYRFFEARIRGEEGLLIKFFGDQYINYRRRVGTKIPFIR